MLLRNGLVGAIVLLVECYWRKMWVFRYPVVLRFVDALCATALRMMRHGQPMGWGVVLARLVN